MKNMPEYDRINSCPSGNEICPARSRKTKILTVGIHWACRGTLLRAPTSESDPEIVKNSHLRMNTNYILRYQISLGYRSEFMTTYHNV